MEVNDKPYTVRKLGSEEYKDVATRLYNICQAEFTLQEWQFLPSVLISCGISWNLACSVDVETLRNTIENMIDAFAEAKLEGIN